MTLDEYLEVRETTPATPNQVGAIHGECQRLGLGDRNERLAACAQLPGLGGLGSTRDLVTGQAPPGAPHALVRCECRGSCRHV
jgi:hypothetical protein